MKKNKKLFAILTLVAFMMTLVPAFAFAGSATNATVTTEGSNIVISTTVSKANGDYALYPVDGNTKINGSAIAKATSDKENELTFSVHANKLEVGTYGLNVADAKNGTECGIIAEVQQDAFDKAFSKSASTIKVVDGVKSVEKNEAKEDAPELELTLRNTDNSVANNVTEDVYVWAEENGKVSDALTLFAGDYTDVTDGVYKVSVERSKTIPFTFQRTGNFELHAAIDSVVDNKTPEIQFKATNVAIEVTSTSESTAEYGIKASVYDKYNTLEGTTATLKDGQESVDKETGLKEIAVSANSIDEKKVVVNVTDKNGNVKEGKDITLETSSDNVVLSKTSGKTDIDGNFTFYVGGVREGNYKIYVKVGSEFEAALNVKVGSTAASNVEVIKTPNAPLATDLDPSDYSKYIRLQMTDANDNLVTANKNEVVKGAESATKSNPNNVEAKYVSFIEKPEASKLDNDDIYVTGVTGEDYFTIAVKDGKKFDKEGKYTIKVVLENGKSTTFSFEVKKFETPVELHLDYPVNTVELGGTTDTPEVYFTDANGVIKDATNRVTLAGTGYALQNVVADDKDTFGKVTVKNDEKYLGQTVTITAVAERENLVTSVDLTVAEDAREVAFSTNKGVIGANNKFGISLVDANGNVVAAANKVNDIQVVVTNVTNDARVSASVPSSAEADLEKTGKAEIALTANKECTADVQVIVKATKDNGNNTGLSTKYYSGKTTITFGNEFKDGQVVMYINSATMLVDGELVEIDAPAVIKDNRTFVPFRALSEAFGAQVEYDEATQTVTAVLDGKTVVLTIGSTVMTVNDEAVTIDVAPYIANSRTMVPVRAVAEAFGFDVEATFNADGSTAGVVFAR